MTKRSAISISLVVLAIFGVAGFIFLKPNPGLVAEKPATVQLPQLLVIEPTASGCSFKVIKNLGDGFQQWFQLPKCPDKTEDMIFDSSQNRLLILQDGKYWSVEKKLGAEVRLLAAAFDPPIEGVTFFKTWIDKKSKSLSVAALISVPTDRKDNPEVNEWRKKLPFLKDTWISLHHQDGSPPEGEPAVAIVAQLDAEHQWKILAEEKTTCCADLAPEFEPVMDKMNPLEGVYSLLDLLMNPVCESQHCDLAKLNPTEKTRDWIKTTFKEGEDESVGYLPMSADDGFIFQTEFGDSNHAMAPIYYCRNHCAEHEPIPSPAADPDFGQVSFAAKSNFMIISKEYEGKDAKVHQAGSSKPVLSLSPSSRTIWLPDEFQF